MKKIAAIYTAPVLVEPVTKLFTEILPDCRLVNIVDDSLIADVIKAGGPELPVVRRLIRYYEACEDMGADAIFNTCSSIGEVASLARSLVGIPIIKIDDSMARKAVAAADTVAVLATLRTTLEPTKRLVASMAKEAGKSVTVIEGLADGAFDALTAGKPEAHDRILLETALKAAGSAQAIVLAQGSMARMEQSIAEKTGSKVFSSLRSGVESVKEFYSN